MELRHLRVFVTVAEALHFGRAAQQLHVAQSAVSQTIRDLEDELQVRLFERTSREVQLTPAGVEFDHFAREALQVVERGVRASRATAQGAQRLTLRLLSIATSTPLVEALATFAREHPEVVIDLQDGPSNRNLEALEAGLCDVALVSVAAAKALDPSFERRLVLSSRLGVAMARTHRFAKRKQLPLAELRGERLLTLRRADEADVRRRLDERLAKLGVVTSPIELSQSEGLLALVAKKLGVAVLPMFAGQGRPRGVVLVPLAEPIRVGLCAVWNAKRVTNATREFLALLPGERP